MRVLVVGSGGREHALCWALAASPLLTKLWCAPGQSRHRRRSPKTCRSVRWISRRWSPSPPPTRSIWWCPARRRRWSPASPTPWGGRHRLLRPLGGGGATRGQQDLHQGAVRRRRHSDRAMGALRRRPGRTRLRPPPRRADGGQGRRAGGRQGRGGGRQRRRGRGRDRRLHGAGRASATAGRVGGDRGMPGRRGGQPVRALRRRPPRCRSARRRTTSASARAIPARTPAAWAPIRRRRR